MQGTERSHENTGARAPGPAPATASPDDATETAIREAVSDLVFKLGIVDTVLEVANECLRRTKDAVGHPDPPMADAWRNAALHVGHVSQGLEGSIADYASLDGAGDLEEARNAVSDLLSKLGIVNTGLQIANECLRRGKEAERHPDPEMAAAWRKAALHIGHVSHGLEGSIADSAEARAQKS